MTGRVGAPCVLSVQDMSITSRANRQVVLQGGEGGKPVVIACFCRDSFKLYASLLKQLLFYQQLLLDAERDNRAASLKTHIHHLERLLKKEKLRLKENSESVRLE